MDVDAMLWDQVQWCLGIDSVEMFQRKDQMDLVELVDNEEDHHHTTKN